MTSNCPFCLRIQKGEYRPEVAGVVSFEPLNPVTPGHRLFVSERHAPNAGSNPMLTAFVMFAAAWEASHWQNANIITSIGPQATQTVSHLHIHMIPRRHGDGLQLPWTNQGANPPSN